MITTIFWPVDVFQTGFCYGWTQPVLSVAGVLQTHSGEDAEAALQRLYESDKWLSLLRSCDANPVILGRCTFEQHPQARESLPCPALDLWYNSNSTKYDFIYYYRHRQSSMRFYLLDILPLDSETEGQQDQSVPSPFRTSTHHGFTLPTTRSGINPVVMSQFNIAKTLEDTIQTATSIQRKSLPQWKLLVSLSQCLVSFFASVIAAISMSLSFTARLLSQVCNAPLPIFRPSPLLKDVSATIQQVDVRAEQADLLIHQYQSLRQRNNTSIAHFSAQYVNFYNTIWLIMNDIIVGTAFGTFLCENHMVLARILNYSVESILINWIQWALVWLNSWPAGLKLNTELSRFYSHTFIDLVVMWGKVLQKAAPYLPAVIYMIGTMSCGGMSMSISLFSDLLSVLTAHIHVCYLISTAVYHRQLKMAGSLWNLFRGKRYNVLRNRNDPWDYDIDQLLFGTILFTLLAFLFPTVLAYYALFAMMRLLTIFLHASLDTLLAFMNHFPLFRLMLRLKDPWRLPSGVYFVISTTSDAKRMQLVLENQPVPFSSIFFQYIRLWSRLSAHYNPLRLLRCVLSGEYLAAIPRYSIRYSKTLGNGESQKHWKS